MLKILWIVLILEKVRKSFQNLDMLRGGVPQFDILTELALLAGWLTVFARMPNTKQKTSTEL